MAMQDQITALSSAKSVAEESMERLQLEIGQLRDTLSSADAASQELQSVRSAHAQQSSEWGESQKALSQELHRLQGVVSTLEADSEKVSEWVSESMILRGS